MAERLALRSMLAGAVLALGCVGAAAATLLMEDRPFDARAIEVLALLAIGALPAGLAAPLAARALASSRLGRALLAGGLALVGGVTGQALAFGLHFYVNAYGEHDDIDSLAGILQVSFTTAHGALYYVLFGLRLLWPLGVAGLAAVAVVAALGPRRYRPPQAAIRTETSAA